MADTTAMFVVGLYQYYLWTGDQALLDQLWPSAKRAMTWVIVDSTKGTNLLNQLKLLGYVNKFSCLKK